jgi:hypothetical protein
MEEMVKPELRLLWIYKGLYWMPSDTILTLDLRDSLQKAAKSATMGLERFDTMTAAKKRSEIPVDNDSVFDDADALIALAQKSFKRAAQEQVGENDRLGIATHGAAGGKLKVRQPPKPRTPGQH